MRSARIYSQNPYNGRTFEMATSFASEIQMTFNILYEILYEILVMTTLKYISIYILLQDMVSKNILYKITTWLVRIKAVRP